MDLQFSPDLDAAWCYAILALIAAFSAKRQLAKLLDPLVSESLTTFKGWMLYAAYFFIPIGLFWFLDRTGAIHDTSLFAAVIIGVAYDRILAGEINSMTVPGATGGMWKPFTAWADRVTSTIKHRLFRDEQRFTDKLIRDVVRDPAKMTALEELLKSRLADPKPIFADIEALNALGPGPIPAWALEKHARLLYTHALSLPDWQYMLMKSRITSKFRYYWYVEQWKSKMISLLMVCLVLVVSSYVAVRITNTPWMVRYEAWRLVKANATEQDRARARSRLITRLKDEKFRSLVVEELIHDLRSPGLSSDRVDSILGMLLEARQSLKSTPELAAPLIDSLRLVGVDSRTRILQTLRFLAKVDGLKLKEDLAGKWQPTDGDSINDLEQYIVDLKQAWGLAPQGARADGSAVGDGK